MIVLLLRLLLASIVAVFSHCLKLKGLLVTVPLG